MTSKEIKVIENKIHPKMRLNGICPYFTMFPLSFPYRVLSQARKTDLVYDPFCGRGTTNYAARLLGIESYGVDSNPVAYAVAQAKMVNIKPSELVYLVKEILANQTNYRKPNGEFWDLAYHPTTLRDICKLREYFKIKHRLNKNEVALRALMLGILHGPLRKELPAYLSNQMPRTFSTKPDYSVKYWKKNSLRPPYVDLVSLISRKTEYIFNNQIPKKSGGKIILGDSRNLNKISAGKFDWIITSPPYYGMSTYPQDQWLRNWFLGGKEKVNYSNASQLNHGSENMFLNDLSKVWINVAKKSKPCAKLIIRFGALPSKSDKTPAELLKESLKLADCGWKLQTIQNAGKPLDSKRQANQFQNVTGSYIEEIDAFAILNS